MAIILAEIVDLKVKVSRMVPDSEADSEHNSLVNDGELKGTLVACLTEILLDDAIFSLPEGAIIEVDQS
jgi:hypothetical protein